MGTAFSFPDRFGEEGGATGFDPKSFMALPALFDGEDYKKGFTITFWVYINEDYKRREGWRPWGDADATYRSFFALTHQESVLGFAHRGDRALLDRYVVRDDGTVKNYPIWFWDPVNFTSRQGWYMVALSYATNHMRCFLFYPDGEMAYAMHYFGIQDLSSATQWGIGSLDLPHTQMLDDFKVYEKTLEKEEVRTLYSMEAPPRGMYRIETVNYPSSYVQTLNKAVDVNQSLSGQSLSMGREFTSQWVFEHMPNTVNGYHIRMGYTDYYLVGSAKAGTHVMTGQKADSDGWIVTPSDNGTFHIRSLGTPDLYWKILVEDGVLRVRLDRMDVAKADFYKWKLSLLKTAKELQDNGVLLNVPYTLVDDHNTVFTVQPHMPFVAPQTELFTGRESISLRNEFIFKNAYDNAVYIEHAELTETRMAVKNNAFGENAQVVIAKWTGLQRFKHQFLIEKLSPYGRKCRIVPVYDQDRCVSGVADPISSDIRTQKISTGNLPSQQWQLYEAPYKHVAPAKEVYQLDPGLYKISTSQPGNLSLCPAPFAWTANTPLNIWEYNKEWECCFYWFLDYERLPDGTPVRDGTYTIQLMGTDKLLAGTLDDAVKSGSQLYLTDMHDNPLDNKWFFKPMDDGSKTYVIQSASDPRLMMHCVGGGRAMGTKIDIADFPAAGDKSAWQWKIERANVPAPIPPGVYKIRPTYYMECAVRTHGDGVKPSNALEIARPTPTGTFDWHIIVNPDHTYMLKLHGTDEQLYISTNYHSLTSGATLMVYAYDPNYAHTYKWMVRPAVLPDSYTIVGVPHPTEQYWHTYESRFFPGTLMEARDFLTLTAESFYWTFQKVSGNSDSDWQTLETRSDEEPPFIEANSNIVYKIGKGEVRILANRPIESVTLVDMAGRTVSVQRFDADAVVTEVHCNPSTPFFGVIETRLASGEVQHKKVIVP